MYRSKKFDDPNQGNVQGLVFQGRDSHGYTLSQLPMLQRFNHTPNSSNANSRYGECSWRGYMGGRLASLYGYNHKPFTTNKYSSCDSSLKGIQVPSTKSSTSTTFDNNNTTKFLFHRWPPQLISKMQPASTPLEECTTNDDIVSRGGLKRKLMSMRPVRSGVDLDLELSLKVSRPDINAMEGNDHNQESSLSLSLSSSSSSKLSEVVRRDNKYNSHMNIEGVDSKRARMASTLDLTL
ncbi:hypothetical protein LINGRAHAP2_LOCUS25965 [Linum grandiflorum]